MKSSRNETGCALIPMRRSAGARNFASWLASRSLYWMILSLVLNGGFLHAVSTVSDLNKEIVILKSSQTATNAELNTTITDVNATYLRLRTETNITGCALVTGAIIHAKANTTINWPVSFVNSTSSVTALQFDASIPSSFTVVSVTIGNASINAGKSVSSNLVNGAERAVIFGLNQTAFGNGPVAVIQWKIGNVPNGLYPISLLNAVASDASGNALPMCTLSGYVEIP